jgi:hypothetical protein
MWLNILSSVVILSLIWRFHLVFGAQLDKRKLTKSPYLWEYLNPGNRFTYRHFQVGDIPQNSENTLFMVLSRRIKVLKIFSFKNMQQTSFGTSILELGQCQQEISESGRYHHEKSGFCLD